MKLTIAVILSTFVTSPVWAEWLPSESGTVSLTKISGNKGTADPTLETRDLTSIVNIAIFEHKDRPCEVLINMSHSSDGKSRKAEEADRRCGKGVSAGNWSDPLLELPPGYIATGFQICQAKKNNRVKGYKLTGRKRSHVRTEKFSSVDQTLPNMRPHCSRWRQERMCRDGAVLTGFKLHYRARSGNKPWELIGMQGMCRNLAWTGDDVTKSR